MAAKAPLANYSGRIKELQSGDTVTGVSLASTTEVLTGTDAAKAVTADALAALWEQGSNIASASTITIGEGGYHIVTGTTTITDIDFGTDKAGRTVILKIKDGLTFTAGSNLVLPGSVDLVAASGSVVMFTSEGSDVVKLVNFVPAGALPVANGGTAGTTVLAAKENLKIPRQLSFSTTDVTTAGTTEETFYTITIPAATLTTNGDRVTVKFPGGSENNTNSKKWEVTIAGSSGLSTTQTVNLRTGWDINIRLIRKSNTEINCISSLQASGSGATATYVKALQVTGLNLTTTAYDVVLKVTTSAAAGDVTAHGYDCDFIPA